MIRLGARLIMCSIAAMAVLLIVAFGMAAWLEGTPDGDGPGVGLGIGLLAGIGILASFVGIAVGTVLLVLGRWRTRH